MGGDQHVHAADYFSFSFQICSNFAIAAGSTIIEGYDFQRGYKFLQGVVVLALFVAFGDTVLKFGQGDGGDGNIRDGDGAEFVEDGKRFAFYEVDANVGVEHVPH